MREHLTTHSIMGVAVLPDGVLRNLVDQFPGRDFQIRTLLTLLGHSCSSPSAVLSGPEAVGKSSILGAVLRALDISHAIVDSRECVTGRQCLERALSVALANVEVASEDEASWQNIRCDSIISLQRHLERLLRGKRRLVLIFDGADRQREAPTTLLPALARFGELVFSSLTTSSSIANHVSSRSPICR